MEGLSSRVRVTLGPEVGTGSNNLIETTGRPAEGHPEGPLGDGVVTHTGSLPPPEICCFLAEDGGRPPGTDGEPESRLDILESHDGFDSDTIPYVRPRPDLARGGNSERKVKTEDLRNGKIVESLYLSWL